MRKNWKLGAKEVVERDKQEMVLMLPDLNKFKKSKKGESNEK